MGSKKHNRVMGRNKLEKKTESGNWRKARKERYKAMSEKGVLGSREFIKYDEMRIYLKKVAPELNFPSMQSEPSRSDYNLLQTAYRKYSGFN